VDETPRLDGDALAAVRHRGSHVQIIASAGSGKTEVVAQRVADLIAEGIAARSIVAFTFTERAAQELKDRIALRVEHRHGRPGLDALGGLFVGTIHSYCFRLLQQYVPRYETYDVLDDNQVTAFLSREASRLGIRDLDANKRLFAAIAAFLQSVEVVENALLDPGLMPEPFRTIRLWNGRTSGRSRRRRRASDCSRTRRLALRRQADRAPSASSAPRRSKARYRGPSRECAADRSD
jgi:DNA helicase II / ATP-dependent DNA helicase PcrA